MEETTLLEMPGKRMVGDGFEHGWTPTVPEITDRIRFVKMVLPPMSQEKAILTWVERDPECVRIRRTLLAIKLHSLAKEAGNLPGHPTLLCSFQSSGLEARGSY